MPDSVDVLVAGGGGFIGGHLVGDLLAQGMSVRSVDIKPRSEWYQVHPDAENVVADLSLLETQSPALLGPGRSTCSPPTWAAWASSRTTRPLCMLSVLTSTHMLQARSEAGVERYFYSSSACVYAAGKQTDPTSPRCGRRTPIRRSRRTATAGRSSSPSACAATSPRTTASSPGWPATTTSTAREGTWSGGREKAPAAVCRKVAEAVTRRATTRSRSGATASRPVASCTSTTASTARR